MPPAGYEPFLEAVLERPADDGPRMIYADWLEEHDDPRRAELLRLHRKLLATCCEPDGTVRAVKVPTVVTLVRDVLPAKLALLMVIVAQVGEVDTSPPTVPTEASKA